MALKTYEVHYKAGDRDWRYAGDIGASSAAAAVRAYKRTTSGEMYRGKKLRARLASRQNSGKRKKLMASGSKKLAAWVRAQGKKNPRTGVKLPRSGHTGFLKAKAVDVVTRGGRVVEVRVKR